MAISEIIALLAACVALYGIHAATTRESKRWTMDRRDRRRERLLLLYADWAARVLEVLSLRYQLAQKPPIRDEADGRQAIQLWAETAAATRLAMQCLNRAWFTIALEEGGELAKQVEQLTHGAETCEADETVMASIRDQLGKLLASKRLSHQPKD